MMDEGKEIMTEIKDYAKKTVDAIAEKYLKPGMEEMLNRASEEYLKELSESQIAIAAALDWIISQLQVHTTGSSHAFADIIRKRLEKIHGH